MKLIQCIVHFSEGQNQKTIEAITEPFLTNGEIQLLGTESRIAENRTRCTIIGTPESVNEAIFKSIDCAKRKIDMRVHQGTHPRQGACDVISMIPFSETTLETCVETARQLAMRIGGELNIPVYCYGEAAFDPKRKSQDDCTKGEYEGLRTKIYSEAWKPDFGFSDFSEEVARSGATCVGVEDSFVEINFNLNSSSKTLSEKVAAALSAEGIRAIGIQDTEHGIAQVATVFSDTTPLHSVWETICEKTGTLGLRVTGSDLVGLISKKQLTDAGRYFLTKQNHPWGVSEKELIRIAVRSMGMEELRPFDEQAKITAYCLDKERTKPIIGQTIESFLLSDNVAAEGINPLLIAAIASRSIARQVYRSAEKEEAQRERHSLLADKCHRKAEELTEATERFHELVTQINAADRLPQESERQKEIYRETIEPLKTALAVTGVNAMSAMCDVVGVTDANFTANNDTINNAFGYLHSAIYDLFGIIKRFVPEEEDADTVLDTFLAIYDGYFDKFSPQEEAL